MVQTFRVVSLEDSAVASAVESGGGNKHLEALSACQALAKRLDK